MDIYSPYQPIELTGPVTLTPRKEQAKAVKDTFDYFNKSKESNPEYLWNAKMRFGKTVSALWLIERLHKEKGLKKVLILTHRPVVNASWYDDFKKVFKDTIDDYAYGTSKETQDELDDFKTIKRKAAKGKCVIFFASIHYLRLSKAVDGAGRGDDAIKNEILDYDWDLVIIDEAHEGTQTNLGANVINYLRKGNTKFLNLSGTPFNLLENFKAGQIYNWDYIQEQESKKAWGLDRADNPYITLPEMEIFTFKMGEMTDESAGTNPATGKFSFSEFFRVKEGKDYTPEERGRFLHEAQVIKFLEKLCEKSDTTHYPFSTKEYRKAFRHTLWVVPGVKEAAALKRLIDSGVIPALSKFKVINVAGQGDADEQRSDALDKVLKGIGVEEVKDKDANGNVIRTHKRDDSDSTRTITLSCGRLTTGVTVAPWTAVLYLKGSETTSASTYMQTIFRVQSPHVHNGMMKSRCYVFDFAPERALTMMAETAKYYSAFESKAKKKGRRDKALVDKEDKEKMTRLLSVCPVYEMSGGAPIFVEGRMQAIDAERLFSQLNEVYVDKVVRSGFDHPSLYNYEALENPSEEDMKLIEIIGGLWRPDSSRDKDSGSKIQVNDLTDEQKAKLKAEAEDRKKAAKKAREEAEKKHAEKLAAMTEEEREKYLADIEEKARKKELIKQNRAKLEGLSKRIPLMMFGADIHDLKERVTIDMFADESFIDNESWAEFMPKEVSREMFMQLAKFYNPDIFRDAGMRIRELAQEGDSMSIEDRIQRIAAIFKFFKNPDKETVLTPWEVVNRHMSETLGGWCFFDTDFKTPNRAKVRKEVDGEEVEEQVEAIEPRFVSQGDVTREVFGDPGLDNIDIKAGRINTRILEINSKTGLYPLYITYTLYKRLLPIYAEKECFDDIKNVSVSEQQALWNEVVENNIYVICNTPMAVRITRRTLLGFSDKKVKTHIKNIKLIDRAQTDREALITDLRSSGFWEGNESKDEMKFNAIVSNPPYQEEGLSTRKAPIYHHFYNLAFELSDKVTLITPGRFLFKAGQTPNDWMEKVLRDPHFKVIKYFQRSTEVFPSVDIKGGVVITYRDAKRVIGPIGFFSEFEELKSILKKVKLYHMEDKEAFDSIVSSQGIYKFSEMAFKENPQISEVQGTGTASKITSLSFENLPNIFLKELKSDFSNYIKILGRIQSKREFRWIKRCYVIEVESLDKWKVFVPEANGTGAIGEILSSPIIGSPIIGSTDTFISVGGFENESEAVACLKYIKTKFARTLLGTLKATQHNPKNTWANVPLQDFTPTSDIDWSKSIAEIDQQLYDKYGLTQEERDFIESKIKAME